jgi:hypothetical protein
MIDTLDQGYAAYKEYVAVKNHFTSPYYDIFKYNGSVKAGRASFERRNDKLLFCKLAKVKDVRGFLVANFVDDPKSWVGDVIKNSASNKVYVNWLARQQSLQYIFETDLQKLDENFDANIVVVGGQHPPLLKKIMRKEISIETVVILNSLCKFFKHWSRSITDEVIWPQFKFRCVKYKPFVQFDSNKFKKIVVDRFKN